MKKLRSSVARHRGRRRNAALCNASKEAELAEEILETFFEPSPALYFLDGLWLLLLHLGVHSPSATKEDLLARLLSGTR